MAVSVNWSTKVISVPQADLTLISGSDYTYSVDTLRLNLKALEAGEAGIVFDDTHTHNTEVTLAGITYARTVEFINGYTIEFEDLQYGVTLTEANHNVSDVIVRNQVSIVTNNSAGLQTVTSGSGLSGDQDTLLTLIGNLTQADQVFDKDTGLLHFYERGTTTDLIPAKTVAGEAQTIDASITE